MITFRLTGSISAELFARMKQTVRRESKETAQAVLRLEIERQLDVGAGPDWLKRAELAAVVEEAMLHFDGERYALLSWCIMSNHVHALVVPRAPYDVSNIAFGWKSFSGQKCNRLLGRRGAFWERDYFDRFIRNDEHLARAIDYVEMNPVKAGLCDKPEEWQWSSAQRREMVRTGQRDTYG